MTPSPGRRFHTTISSAPTTSSVRRWSAMDHLTTRRLNTSRTIAREIGETLLLRRHIRDVRDPQHVRRAGRESVLHQIGSRLGPDRPDSVALRGVWGLARAPAMAPDEAVTTHETSRALAPAWPAPAHHFG